MSLLNLSFQPVFVCEALFTFLCNSQCSLGDGKCLPRKRHVQFVVISEYAQISDQLLQSFLHLASRARVVAKLRRGDHVLIHLYVEIHRRHELVAPLYMATAQIRLEDFAGEVTHVLAQQNLLKFTEYLIGDVLGFAWRNLCQSESDSFADFSFSWETQIIIKQN